MLSPTSGPAIACMPTLRLHCSLMSSEELAKFDSLSFWKLKPHLRDDSMPLCPLCPPAREHRPCSLAGVQREARTRPPVMFHSC